MAIRVQIAGGSIVEFPDGTDQETIKNALSNQVATPPQAPQKSLDDASVLGEFWTGLKAGTASVKTLMADALPAQMEKLTGDKEGFKKQFADYQTNIQKISNKYPAAVPSIAGEGFNPKKFALYTARLVGEGIPSLGPMYGAAVAGGVAGGPIGAAAGASIVGYALNTPESYTILLEDDSIENPERWALGVGLLKTGLDMLPITRLFGKTFGKGADLVLTKKVLSKAGFKQAAKKVGEQAAEQFALEGITEAMQEGVDIAAKQLLNDAPDDFFTKENLLDMARAGYAGALVGGITGGVGGTIQVAKAPRELSEDERTALLKIEMEDMEDLPLEDRVVDTPEEAVEVLKDLKLNPKLFPTDEMKIKAANYEVTRPLRQGQEPKIPDVGLKIRDAKSLIPTTKSGLLGTPSYTPITASSQIQLDNSVLESVRTNTDLNEVFDVANTQITPRYQRADFTPLKIMKKETSYDVFVDNPQGDWLQRKQEAALEEYNVSKKGFGAKGLYGSVTAGIRSTKENKVMLPTDMVARLKGINNEQKYRDDPKKTPKLAKIMKDLKEGIRQPIDIRVNHFGEAYISEGNHRAMAAFKAGLPEVPVSITYHNGAELIDGPLSPDKIQRYLNGDKTAITSREDFQYNQTTQPLSYTDTLSENEVPVVYDVVRGVQFKDNEVTPNSPLGKVHKQIENVVSGIAGKDLQVNFMKDLKEYTGTPEGTPVRGVQAGNGIYLATKMMQNTNLNPYETAFHEAWHWLYDERMGLFSKADRKIIESSYPEMVKYLENKFGIKAQDVALLYGTGKEGQQEVVATLFGQYAVNQQEKVPNKLKKFFNKALNFLRNLGRGLRGKGFRNFEDVFQKVLEGDVAPSVAMERAVNEMQVARLQRLSDALWTANRRSLEEEQNFRTAIEHDIKEARERLSEPRSVKDWLFDHARLWFATSKHNAHRDALFATPYLIIEEMERTRNVLMTRFKDVGKKYISQKNPAVQIEANRILELLRKTEQTLNINEAGELTYIDNGKLFRVKNPEFVEVVKSLDSMYKEPMKVTAEYIENDLKKFAPTKSVTAIKKELLEKNQKDLTDEETRLQLKAAVHSQIKRLLSNGYFPFMRFGQYGLTVYSKDDLENGVPKTDADPLYFAMIEEGSFKNKFNKTQMDKVQKDLKEKGFINNPNVVISKPFVLTQEQTINQIPNTAITIELLYNLLGNARSEQEYHLLLDKVKDRISTKGLARRYTESKNIPGNSQDYLRVADAYVSSSANYLSRMNFIDDLQAFKTKVETGLGGGARANQMKKNLVDYIDYALSSDQEFQRFVTFNFLWTMGANPSSAAIQPFGLFTFTLGSLSRFDGNVFRNIGRIASSFRSLWNGLEKGKTMEIKKGGLRIRFDEWGKNLAGDLSKDEIDALRWFYSHPSSGEQILEEQFGRTRAETRSIEGQVGGLSETLKNFVGIPMSFAEQITRGASFLAAYRTFRDAPQAIKNAEQTLANDKLWNKRREGSIGSPQEHDNIMLELAAFVVDDSHGVFGKRGRGKAFRGPGRIVFPFATFVMSMNEMMLRMATGGPNGARGLAVTLGSIMFMAGAMGLPGAELLKELFEEAYKVASGKNIDLEIEMRKLIVEATNSKKAAMTATQGVFSGATPYALGPRLRAQIAGQDLLLAIMGVRGGFEDIGGVQGSVIGKYIDAFNLYREGGSKARVAEKLSPTALSNLIKAYTYNKEGVYTIRGDRTVSPEEYKAIHTFSRILGFRTTLVADRSEEKFWSTMLNEKYKPKLNTLRKRGQNIVMKIIDAQKSGDLNEADKQRQELRKVYSDLSKFLKDNKIYYDVSAFNRSIYDKVEKNLMSGLRLADFDKIVRPEAVKLREITGRYPED